MDELLCKVRGGLPFQDIEKKISSFNKNGLQKTGLKNVVSCIKDDDFCTFARSTMFVNVFCNQVYCNQYTNHFPKPVQ